MLATASFRWFSDRECPPQLQHEENEKKRAAAGHGGGVATSQRGGRGSTARGRGGGIGGGVDPEAEIVREVQDAQAELEASLSAVYQAKMKSEKARLKLARMQVGSGYTVGSEVTDHGSDQGWRAGETRPGTQDTLGSDQRPFTSASNFEGGGWTARSGGTRSGTGATRVVVAADVGGSTARRRPLTGVTEGFEDES
jgi:hypothetical protein